MCKTTKMTILNMEKIEKINLQNLHKLLVGAFKNVTAKKVFNY